MRFLSLNKRNNLLPKLFDFAEPFRFARLPLILHVQIREKPVLKIFGDDMWEKESIIDVQCPQQNPNPPVHRSSGKLGKPRFLERWTRWLEFSCLHWTPMMDSIYLSYNQTVENENFLLVLHIVYIIYRFFHFFTIIDEGHHQSSASKCCAETENIKWTFLQSRIYMHGKKGTISSVTKAYKNPISGSLMNLKFKVYISEARPDTEKILWSWEDFVFELRRIQNAITDHFMFPKC